MSIGLKGNVDGSGAVQVGGSDAITIATDTTVTMNGGVQRPLLSGTSVASTSGTSIDFTGIPSWVKRVTVMFSGVSTNGTSKLQVQIGSGTIATSGYASNAGALGAAASTSSAGSPATTGFVFTAYAPTAASLFSGNVTLAKVNENTWVCSGVVSDTTNVWSVSMAAGNTTLAGVLDRVRITTVNGTDTFDAGTINILYE